MDATEEVQLGFKREAAPEAPALKRKKTVTWADGEIVPEESEDEDFEMEEAAAAAIQAVGPSVVVLPPEPDDLFADLDESALQQQAAVAKTENEPLDKQQLLQRRAGQVDELIGTYEAELWALADELLLRRLELHKAQPETPVLKAGAAAPVPPHAAAAAALATGGVQAAWEAMHRRRHGRGIPTAPPALPGCEEIEALVLSLPLSDGEGAEALRQRLVRRREDFLRQLSMVGRLEAAALAVSSRELDTHGAVAALCGRRCRYLLRRTAVVLGRSAGPKVDVDLSREAPGAAAAVSRLQAHIFLDANGTFKLHCLGRRPMSVNGKALGKGQLAALPHLSIVRAGQVALLWVVNRAALDRLLRRSASQSIY